MISHQKGKFKSTNGCLCLLNPEKKMSPQQLHIDKEIYMWFKYQKVWENIDKYPLTSYMLY